MEKIIETQKQVDDLTENIESSIRERKMKIMKINTLKQELVSVGIAVTAIVYTVNLK